jgi:hypothetical protein
MCTLYCCIFEPVFTSNIVSATLKALRTKGFDNDRNKTKNGAKKKISFLWPESAAAVSEDGLQFGIIYKSGWLRRQA